ncbi:MAG: hypothetical protein ABI818_05020, partial [Acidobacteriota bacterium]
HFDDAHVVENNLYIRSLSSIPRFFTDATTFSSLPPHASYRPVVSTTLAIDYAIAGGLNPRQFHRTQIALLLLLGVLLVLFYHRVLREADAAVSLYVPIVAAALFCVHTANTETMNLISARSELLSVLGVVGSFVAYLEYPQWRRTGLHLLPMVLGSLAKVHAVMYAPLLFAYVFIFWNDQAPGRRRWQEAFRATWPSFAAAAVVYLLHRPDDRQAPSGHGQHRLHAGLLQSRLAAGRQHLRQRLVLVAGADRHAQDLLPGRQQLELHNPSRAVADVRESISRHPASLRPDRRSCLTRRFATHHGRALRRPPVRRTSRRPRGSASATPGPRTPGSRCGP